MLWARSNPVRLVVSQKMKTLDSMETYEKINLADYFQAAVHALQVAAENKHLIGLQHRYLLRCKVLMLNSIVRSHIGYEVTKNSRKKS